MHLKSLSCRKIHKKKTGNSEELCVYLTMVFSNKMMKGLLIVISVSVRLSVFVPSETAGAVKHYERRQRAFLSK